MLELAISSLLALGVTAQEFGLPSGGPNKFGPGDTPESEQFFENAGRQPNATDSVTFTRVYNGTEDTWTWRVNITEFAVPDSRVGDLGLVDPNATYSLNYHAVNTQWQVDWPAGQDGQDFETLQDYLTTYNYNVTFRATYSNKPANITDRYNAADNGDCASIVGDECLRAIEESASDEDLSSIPGCEDTLGFRWSRLPLASGGGSLSITAGPEPDFPLLRGDPWYYSVGRIYQGSDLQVFNSTKAALQVFVMSVDRGVGQEPFLQTNASTVICRIVEQNAATFSDEGGYRIVGDEPTGPSSAGRLEMGSVALAGALMLGAAAFML